MYQCIHVFLTSCNLTTYYNFFLVAPIIQTRNIKPFTHPAFTCSKSTIETLRQGVKIVQS